MSNRLKRLIEFKKYEKMSLDELINEYITLLTLNASNSLNELLDELLILINRYEGSITKSTLQEIATLTTLSYSSNSPRLAAIIPLMYEKIFTDNTNLKLVFGATDEQAIKALENKLLWIGENSAKRVSDKLHSIFTEVYQGKYTHEELINKFRFEFDEYRDIEIHKLEAAADFTLRQGRNLGRVSRAIEMKDEYMQVVAKIDDRTTNICRSMHLRVIKVSDIKKQYNTLTNAQSVQEIKGASDLSISNSGLWTRKLPANFGIPPYHFGCRTIVRTMSSIQIEKMQLDEFGREYEVRDKEIYNKIKNKHLTGRYKSVEQLVKATMSDIAKEGVHYNNSSKRVIWGNNGYTLILDRNGKIETVFGPSRSINYFYDNTNEVYYDKTQQAFSLIQKVKKWLGL
jgi:hypothetical protein